MGYNTFPIDREKLKKEIKKRGMTAKDISLEIGYSGNYLSNVINYGSISASAAKLLEAFYKIPRSAYEITEEEPKEKETEPRQDLSKVVYEATYRAVYNAIDDSGILDVLKDLKEVWK